METNNLLMFFVIVAVFSALPHLKSQYELSTGYVMLYCKDILLNVYIIFIVSTIYNQLI